MALTDIAIRKAKARDAQYRLSDEKGLYLLVRPDGAKWWRQDFTLHGSRRTMGLGTYPNVELADARIERDRVRKLVAAGVDPVHERRTGAGDDDARFEAIARKWIFAQRETWTERYHDFVVGRLEANIFPELGRRDIRTIEPPDMLKTIRKIECRGALEVSARMNNVCGRIFRYAIAEGWATRDPTADIRDALKMPPPKKHRAALTPSQVPPFLVKLSDDDSEERDTLDAMWLTIWTVVRTVETRFADKAEFEGLDGKAPLWRIPAERMKMRNPHLVPLSKQAAALVRRRISMMRPGQTLLFARPTVSGSISENTMLYALYRLGYRGRATMHGFRGTFSTVANEHGFNSDWVERQLAHVERDEVRAAYNAAEYMPGRRKMLQWWADWLDEQEQLARLIG